MRVMLIDDHALFRIGLQELLERRGIDVIAIGDCLKGIETVAQERPDAVLLDMRMPDMTGTEVLSVLRKHYPDMPISMLTTSREEGDVIEALQNGAQGYLLKDMEPNELVEALQQITRGQTVVAKELTGILAKAVQGDRPSSNSVASSLDELTPREREILCHLADGQSNKVIARNLGISDGTVKLHVKAILRKLDVHSRVEAAVIAVEQNLCSRG
ncbi:MAG: response regulator [Candidatus Thiodiazotropha sp.]|jgi:two-component system, NarL family, nitrate/nitrite response regulator NarL